MALDTQPSDLQITDLVWSQIVKVATLCHLLLPIDDSYTTLGDFPNFTTHELTRHLWQPILTL